MSTIQGNFLSPGVQKEVKRFLSDPDRGRPKQQLHTAFQEPGSNETSILVPEEEISYIDLERHTLEDVNITRRTSRRAHDGPEKMVDVVLSDMYVSALFFV